MRQSKGCGGGTVAILKTISLSHVKFPSDRLSAEFKKILMIGADVTNPFEFCQSIMVKCRSMDGWIFLGLYSM
jgi:hypothetical protein